ncbi:MAG: glycosyltransferase, partial [Chloroflexota bacterium]|nr:glycosyltransferase [Chloroflexota bacterium]
MPDMQTRRLDVRRLGHRRPQLIVVDQTLTSYSGHNYEYDVSVAEAARDAGMEPMVLANLKMPGTMKHPTIEIRPCIDHWWTWVADSNQEGNQLNVRHGHFGFQLLDVLSSLQLGPRDHVFVHTMDAADLEQLLEALVTADVEDTPVFHLLLRRDAGELSVAWGGKVGLKAQLRRFFRSGLWPDKVVFYTDTEELKAQYDSQSPVSFVVAPIPFRHEHLRERRRDPAASIHIVYLGQARTEKGFAELPAIIAGVYGEYVRTGKARFTIQSKFNIPGGEPGIPQVRQALAEYPGQQVTLLDDPLNVPEYYGLVNSADVILVPYLEQDYRARSSGVLVEALAAGKPVVTRRGTWGARQLDPTRGRDFSTPQEASAAIAEVVDNFEAFEASATAFKGQWRQRHSPKALVNRVLEGQSLARASAAAAYGHYLATSPAVLMVVPFQAMIEDHASLQEIAMLLGYLRRCHYRVLFAGSTSLAAADPQTLAAHEQRFQSMLRDLEVVETWPLSTVTSPDSVESPGTGNVVMPEGLARLIRSGQIDAIMPVGAGLLPLCRALGLQSERTAVYIRGPAPGHIAEPGLDREVLLCADSHVAGQIKKGAPTARVHHLPVAVATPPVGSEELAGCLTAADVLRAAGISAGRMSRAGQLERLLVRASLAKTLDLLYIGNSDRASSLAFEWFFDDVFEPFLAAQGLTLVVSGSIGQALQPKHHSHAQLLITGPVERVRPLLAAARLLILPFRDPPEGSVAIVEALVCGKPVVATSAAIRGLQFNGSRFPVFDDSRAFAEQVLEACEHWALRQGLRLAAYAAGLEASNSQRFDAEMTSAMGEVLGLARQPQPLPPPAALPPLAEWSPAIQGLNRGLLSRLAGGEDAIVQAAPVSAEDRDALVRTYQALLVNRSAPLLQAHSSLRQLVESSASKMPALDALLAAS